MATFTKRGSGWRFKVSYQDADGKRQYINRQGFRTKTEAAAAARKVERELDLGTNLKAADRPLVELYDKWWKTYKQGRKAAVTEYRYKLVGEQLTTYFGNKPIKEITPMVWQTFINDYATGWNTRHRSTGEDDTTPKPRAKETVQKLNGYIRAMVKYLINEQVLHTDFTFGAELPTDRDRTKPNKYLELPYFERLTAYSHEHARFTSLSTLAVYVGAQTGMRVSEVLGLTWNDLNADKLTLDVKRTWDYHRGSGFMPTKNESSVRTIEITQNLADTLDKVHSQQAAWMLKSGIRDKNNCIFFGSTGKVLSQASCGKTLVHIQNVLKVPADKQITFHGLRHSHVSFLLAKGVDIYYISRRLGHADVGVTMRVYSHLLDAQRRTQSDKAVKALAAL